MKEKGWGTKVNKIEKGMGLADLKAWDVERGGGGGLRV